MFDAVAEETLAELILSVTQKGVVKKSHVAKAFGKSYQMLWLLLKGETFVPNDFEKWDEIARVLMVPLPRVLSAVEASAALAKASKGKKVTEPYSNLDIPNANRAVAAELMPIPEWECAVAAGEWVDCNTVAAFDTNSQEYRSILRQGLFRIRIAGDSKEDVWHDGSLVEFKRLYADEGGFVKGEDYYVHRADNTATFKRFVKSDDDSHYFAAVNRKKYRNEFVIPRQEVLMVGLALHMIVPPKRKR